MEIDWGLLFGAVLNFFLLVGLMGLVVSYVKKPTIAKKRALVVLAVLVLIGTREILSRMSRIANGSRIAI